MTEEQIDNLVNSIEERMENKKEKVEPAYFNTGSDLVDLVVGGGVGNGFPAGRIINIVGDKSTGKSFIAAEIVANAYHKYGKKFKWCYDDCESGFTFNTEYLYGFDIHKGSVQSNTVEEMYGNCRTFLDNLKKDEVGIYVVDSLDGLSSDQILEISDERYKAFQSGKKYEKGSYKMEAAKFLSQEFFRGLSGVIERKNCMLLIISQVRDNIDFMSMRKYKRSGGKALDHACHTVLWLSSLSKFEEKGRTIGLTIKAKTEKSKTPRPFRECIFSLYFDYGIDNIGSNIDYLFDLMTPGGKVKKTSTVVWSESKEKDKENITKFLLDNGFMDDFKQEYDGSTIKGDMIEYIEDNPDVLKIFNTEFGEPVKRQEMINKIDSDPKMAAELTERVRGKWEEIEEAIKVNRKRKY